MSLQPKSRLKIKAIGLTCASPGGARARFVTKARRAAPNRRSRPASPGWRASFHPAAPCGEKTRFLDFPVGRPLAQNPEAADDVGGHVVAPRRLAVEEEAVHDGRPFDRNARLLLQFALERLAGRSPRPRLRRRENASRRHSRAAPAGFRRPALDHDRAHPKRHRPGEEEAPVHKPQLQPFSNRCGHGLRVLRTPTPTRGCLCVQAILLPRGQWLEAFPRWRAGAWGAFPDELHHRAYHRPAPKPGADAGLRRFAPQAGHGIHQLEARARAAQRHGAS